MLKNSKLAYRIYGALYVSMVMMSVTMLLLIAPHGQQLTMMVFTLAGVASWTAIEYTMHRFVLHGPLFSRWHMAHHQRPAVLIHGTMMLSAMLIILLMILPALLLGNVWRAVALSLGLLTGYAGYALTHQAIHHCHTDNAWLAERRRWHVQYHHDSENTGYYGVTNAFWDHVFGSMPQTVASTSA